MSTKDTGLLFAIRLGGFAWDFLRLDTRRYPPRQVVRALARIEHRAEHVGTTYGGYETARDFWDTAAVIPVAPPFTSGEQAVMVVMQAGEDAMEAVRDLQQHRADAETNEARFAMGLSMATLAAMAQAARAYLDGGAAQ